MVLSSFISFYPPYFFCKVNANERNGKEILSFYLLRSMIFIIFISIFRPCPKSFLRLRSIPFKSQQLLLPLFHISKNEAASRRNITPRCLILYISNPRNHPLLYISSKIKIIYYIFIPRAKKSPSFHLLLRHKSFPSLVIIEDANLGNSPFRFVSYFDSCLRIIIWCTINTLSSLKQSAIILWGRRGT